MIWAIPEKMGFSESCSGNVHAREGLEGGKYSQEVQGGLCPAKPRIGQSIGRP